ncbi:Anaphase-promoting complex subunit 10 [Triticum urartu]|uniref:Anaphase-promoting complex subunit 10 n=1 Tax=Triticum urartu TaxID=4572 RepID=M7Z1D6_TRIUA|nr:Anaphase-promoting complex subunit 10 [Triticum urartu]
MEPRCLKKGLETNCPICCDFLFTSSKEVRAVLSGAPSSLADFIFLRSDGVQPHLVTIEFQLVTLYMDFKLDESYTPSKISIWTGDGFQNLKAQKLGFKICLIENRSGVHVHNQAVTPSTT